MSVTSTDVAESGPALTTAIPILGEKVRLFRWGAIVLGLAGVLVALQPGSAALGKGHLAALLAVLFSATSAVTTRKIAGRERTATLILYPLLANGAVGAVIELIRSSGSGETPGREYAA